MPAAQILDTPLQLLDRSASAVLASVTPGNLPGPSFYKAGGAGGAGATSGGSPQSVANVRTAAQATITIAGTNAATDVSLVSFANPLFTTLGVGPIQVVSRALAGETTAAAEASRITNDINNSAALKVYGIYATVSGAVITLNHPGPVGNSTTCTFTASTGAQTGTVSNAGVLSGGSGPCVSAAAWGPFNTGSGQYAGVERVVQQYANVDVALLLTAGAVLL